MMEMMQGVRRGAWSVGKINDKNRQAMPDDGQKMPDQIRRQLTKYIMTMI